MMLDKKRKRMKAFWTDLWWLLLYAFAGIVLTMACSAGFVLVNGNGTLTMHLVQWLQTILLMIVPALLWVKMYKKESVAEVMRLKKPTVGQMVMAMVLMVVSLPWLSAFENLSIWLCDAVLPEGVTSWAQQMLEQQKVTLATMLAVDGLWGWTELILLMCIATAIGEELMFRGALLRCFGRGEGWSRGRLLMVACAVGLIFSACHGDLYGLLPRWLLGAGFVYAVVWTGSIWPAVAAHAVNNLFALIQMKAEPEWMAGLDESWCVAVSMVLTAALAAGWVKGQRSKVESQRSKV